MFPGLSEASSFHRLFSARRSLHCCSLLFLIPCKVRWILPLPLTSLRSSASLVNSEFRPGANPGCVYNMRLTTMVFPRLCMKCRRMTDGMNLAWQTVECGEERRDDVSGVTISKRAVALVWGNKPHRSIRRQTLHLAKRRFVDNMVYLRF